MRKPQLPEIGAGGLLFYSFAALAASRSKHRSAILSEARRYLPLAGPRSLAMDLIRVTFTVLCVDFRSCALKLPNQPHTMIHHGA